MKTFYQILANTVIANLTSMTVWFALTFYLYLQTQSVAVTGTISGIYLVVTAATGIWLGSLVDHYKKKPLLIGSTIISLTLFVIGFAVYLTSDPSQFTNPTSPALWVFTILLLAGVMAGNIRGIIMPTLVSILVPEDQRDRANGLLGTVFGIVFLLVSVFSGLLVAHSGMYLTMILGIAVMVIALLHLLFTQIDEPVVVHIEQPAGTSKIDLKGTFAVVNKIPGLFALIIFTTINNFLGGVFMALMDAYGLSLVSVQVWGFIWGILSTAFIVGGMYIAKFGIGKNPVKALFVTNIILWIISSIFTIQASIILLMIGMFLYLAIVPFIEAAEHTIIQKVVPQDRQGRVFGFAQSVEQSASPLTAFLIGPLTQLVFIPFMTTGKGVELIGSWFGTGPARGIALVFTLTGVIGLTMTILAMRTKHYKNLSDRYQAKTIPAAE